MIKSIEYFEKKCIKKFEELENNFMREPNRLAEYVLGLTDELHKLGLEGTGHFTGNCAFPENIIHEQGNR